MTLPFILLMIGAYLLGSIPFSFLVARARGVDLRKSGTQQIGAGNVRRNTSVTLGAVAGAWDFFKGIGMVIAASQMGFEPALQLAVGVSVIIGHNWPIFLKFHGGRGIATTAGILGIMPVINENISFWGITAFLLIIIVGSFIFHETPVAVLLGIAVQPVLAALQGQPPALTLGYLALLFVIIVKRLTAQRSPESYNISFGHVLLNRLLYDRDIDDRKSWLNRKFDEKKGKA